MGQCTLPHIPQRLHWNDRNRVDEFYQDEKLFRRTPDASVADPFTVSLYDISVNRQGPLDGILGEEQDVLLNVVSDTPATYEEQIVVLKVERPSPKFKTYIYIDEELPYLMELLHDPLDCNFYHAIFRIYYTDESGKRIIISKDNYKQTLGQGSSTIKRLRGRIRQELKNMRYRKEVILNSQSPQ